MSTPANVFLLEGTQMTELHTNYDGNPDTVLKHLSHALAQHKGHEGTAEVLSELFSHEYNNVPADGRLGLNIVDSYPVVRFDRSLLSYDGVYDYVVNLAENTLHIYHTPDEKPLLTTPMSYLKVIRKECQIDVRKVIQTALDMMTSRGYRIAAHS